MSGMIMLCRDNGIELFCDAGSFRSTSDFTLTGFKSKPIVLTHLRAAIALCGPDELGAWLQYNRQPHWHSFDDLMVSIRDDIAEGVETLSAMKSSRHNISAAVCAGGFSEKRQCWESCLWIVNAKHGQEPKIDVFDNRRVLFAPAADTASLTRYGFDPDDIGVHTTEDAVRYMRAMRATANDMDQQLADASPRSGSTIAGFIECATVTESYAVSQILWRWPDEVGKLVNPENEGEATPTFTTLLHAAETARENGRVSGEFEEIASDPANSPAIGESG